MKRTLLIAALLALAGCASAPKGEQSLSLDNEVHPMSRADIINAVRECEDAGLRAVVINGKRKINGYTSDVVVDVTCAPAPKKG